MFSLLCLLVNLFRFKNCFGSSPIRILKINSLASCSRFGYKMEVNIFYARETEKAKIKCPLLCGSQ